MSRRIREWAGAGWITAFVCAIEGLPAPASNEYIYMPLLKTVADPGYLANDWTFAAGFAEKSVFNLTFSLPMRILDMEALAWTGRIVFWLLMARLVIAVGHRLGAATWVVVVGVMSLIPVGWSMGVGSESFFGHFEASLVAWPLFLGSLVMALDRRTAAAAALVGLTFSFHPSIGFWAGGSVLLALLSVKDLRMATLRVLPVAAVAALPGLWLLLAGDGAPRFDAAAVEFIVVSRIPHHVDPTAFGERGPLIMSLMLGVNVGWAWWNRDSYHWRLLGVMQGAAVCFFVFGLAARVVERFDLLLLLPFQFAAALTPLVFVLIIGSWVGRRHQDRERLLAEVPGRILIGLAVAAVVGFLVLWNPLVRAPREVSENLSSWSVEAEPLGDVLTWIERNTPEDAIVAAPPWREDLFFTSGRAQLVSWDAVTYDRPGEWIDRLSVTVRDIRLYENVKSAQLLEQYSTLGLEHWLGVRDRYGVSHVVTTEEFDAPILHSAGDWRVYRLPAG